MTRTSTLALAAGLVLSLGIATPAAAQGHKGGNGHGRGHAEQRAHAQGRGHSQQHARSESRGRESHARTAPTYERRSSDVRYSTSRSRTDRSRGMSDILRERAAVARTRDYDRDRRYDRNGRYDRNRRYDRDRYDRNRVYRYPASDRYYQQGKGGPKFCRTGAGHPVYGRAWCIQKGFGLGGRGWDRVSWGDVRFRDSRYSGTVGKRGLSDILGDMVYGRLDTRRRTFGYADPLTGRWFRTESGAPALLVSAGAQALAELIDGNGDGLADMVLLRRR